MVRSRIFTHGAVAIVLAASLVACSSSDSSSTKDETSNSAAKSPESTEADNEATTTTEESTTTTEETTTTLALPKTFDLLEEREWKLLEKNPDGHKNEGVKIYGEIFQFDSNTGTQIFMAHGYRNEQARSSDPYGNRGSLLLVAGEEALLEDFLQGDKFICDCVVGGSYAYDTKAGGSNNAIALLVKNITHG